MWYIIVSASGLGVGLGLLIWVLVERSKRADAVKEATAAEALKIAAVRDLADAKAIITRLQSELSRMSESANVCRENLSTLRTKLEKVNDPTFIRKMLDELLSEKIK